MKLLTEESIQNLPPIHSTEEKDPSEVPIITKFFCPWNSWTWFVTEGERIDPSENDGVEDFLFFGYVIGHFKELGYFSLNEMEEVRGPGGLTIERDLYFGQATLADVISGKKR